MKRTVLMKHTVCVGVGGGVMEGIGNCGQLGRLGFI